MIKHNNRKFEAWRRSYRAARDIYDLTRSFPSTERYGLALQIQRASVSIPSNIAEGSAEGSGKGFRRYLRIALGSACELETQLELSGDLGFCSKSKTRRLLIEDRRDQANAHCASDHRRQLSVTLESEVCRLSSVVCRLA